MKKKKKHIRHNFILSNKKIYPFTINSECPSQHLPHVLLLFQSPAYDYVRVSLEVLIRITDPMQEQTQVTSFDIGQVFEIKEKKNTRFTTQSCFSFWFDNKLFIQVKLEKSYILHIRAKDPIKSEIRTYHRKAGPATKK